MSLPFFYQPSLPNSGRFILTEETSKHCVQVLRMKNGDSLQITDGEGKLLEALIVSDHKKYCEVQISSFSIVTKPLKEICLGISLLKNASRLEWLFEKITELGICVIIPMKCNRTEKQQFRYDRMKNILISAMLQSKQAWLPILKEPCDFMDIVNNKQYKNKLIAHCEVAEKTMLSKIIFDNQVQILIGPEGDFTPSEIEYAIQNGYKEVSLGVNRLRTETAGIVATTLLVNSD